MKKEITKIPVIYNSLRLSLITAIFSFPVIGIIYVFSLFSVNPASPNSVIFVTAPIISAITIFILTSFFCLIYNFVSKRIGGIKVMVNNE